MKEIVGDIFSHTIWNIADAICITTNGFVKKDGSAVMGAGVAKAAKEKFPDITFDLASYIKENGNKVQIIKWLAYKGKEIAIVAYPTKHNFWEKSDINLIVKSAWQLKDLTDCYQWNKVIVPRPGCSNGKLSWISDVKPVITNIFDDRFYLIQK